MRGHKRSLLLALLLCCIAVVAMAGIYKRETDSEEEYDDLVKLEEGAQEEVPDDEEVSALISAAGLDGGDAESETPQDREETDADGEPVPIITEDSVQETSAFAQEADAVYEDTEEALSGTVASDLNFQESSVLTWPVQGEVLMEYSMEQPVYFATLKQYKTNPGILIQSAEGEMVYAGADGCVTSIAQSDELGCTVTLDLGNGYSAVYGQLKSLNVLEGDMVSTGTALGLTAAPTKYYCVEGDHVYLQLNKDGAPVDPLDYLD